MPGAIVKGAGGDVAVLDFITCIVSNAQIVNDQMTNCGLVPWPAKTCWSVGSF